VDYHSADEASDETHYWQIVDVADVLTRYTTLCFKNSDTIFILKNNSVKDERILIFFGTLNPKQKSKDYKTSTIFCRHDAVQDKGTAKLRIMQTTPHHSPGTLVL